MVCQDTRETIEMELPWEHERACSLRPSSSGSADPVDILVDYFTFCLGVRNINLSRGHVKIEDVSTWTTWITWLIRLQSNPLAATSVAKRTLWCRHVLIRNK
ncbi:hypothetical protein FOZ62_012394, partial [Perkinsus olseni]